MKHAWFLEMVKSHAESYLDDMMEKDEDALPILELFVKWMHENTTLDKERPYWYDGCKHTNKQLHEGEYIGSFTINDEKYDVYTFLHHEEEYTCIRYGSKNSEYNSPGSVSQLGSLCANHPYSAIHVTAYAMILEHQREKNNG